MAKAILNISNYSGGLNNKTNSRDIEDNQFQDLDSLSIETPGKLKIMGAAIDYPETLTYYSSGYSMSGANNDMIADASDTSFTIIAPSVPSMFANNVVIKIDSEEMVITSTSHNSNTAVINVTRAQNSTSLAIHDKAPIFIKNLRANQATSVNYANGIFHFNADYDIDDTTGLFQNNEIIFLNTNSGTSNAPIVKPYELNSDKVGFSQRDDLVYGDTFSPVVYSAVDGTVRITPTSFVDTNRPIRLQHIDEELFLGFNETITNSLYVDSTYNTSSALSEGSTSLTTTHGDEDSYFEEGDRIKLKNSGAESSIITLTGATDTTVKFDSYGGNPMPSGSDIYFLDKDFKLFAEEKGWKKLNTDFPEVTEDEVKVWNFTEYNLISSPEFIIDTGATLQGTITGGTTHNELPVSDSSKFTVGDYIKIVTSTTRLEYCKVNAINSGGTSNTIDVIRDIWGQKQGADQVSGAAIHRLHYTVWGEFFSIPTTQSGSNPFYVTNNADGRGPINVGFWIGTRNATTGTNTTANADTGKFFTAADSVINIYSEIVYLDGQRSPLKLHTTLESHNNVVNQSIQASIWGRVPNIPNIKSIKFYYVEAVKNYEDSGGDTSIPARDYIKNKIKYLLFEVDFRKGIRYAGGKDYYNMYPVAHSTAGKSTYVYPKTIDSYLSASNRTHFLLSHIQLKEKPETVSAEAYVEVDDSVIGVLGTGYKASTVANRRLYVGNVRYIDPVSKKLTTANDTILKSNVNAFDTFIFENRIDVEVNDGDDIIALESLGPKLLEFKRNHLYIINIARDIEFLEATLEYKGCEKDYHIVRGEGFISWFNKFGFYLYDGKQVKNVLLDKMVQEKLNWDSYYDVNNVISYDPEQKTILILNKNQRAISYDIKSSGLSGRTKATTTNDITNIVTSNDGDLLWFEKISGTNVSLRKFKIAPSKLDTNNIDEIALKTKEYTFGKPSVDKKIISVYLSYKNGDGVFLRGFNETGEEEILATLDGSSETNFKTLHIPIRKAKTEFVNKKAFDKIKGFGLRFSGSDVATDFEINDMQIIFREKSVK